MRPAVPHEAILVGSCTTCKLDAIQWEASIYYICEWLIEVKFKH